MEELIVKLAALYYNTGSGDDWYNVKIELLDCMDYIERTLKDKFNDREIYMMRDGEFIGAIKAYRERTGMNLAEAKRKVQNYMHEFSLVNRATGKVPEKVS